MAGEQSGSGSGLERPEFAAAIAELREAAQAMLDPNDLGCLAQMHTWCQTLTPAPGAIGELARAVAELLEAVILNEASDTDAGLALIQPAVEALEGGLAGRGGVSPVLLAQIRAAVTREPAEVPAGICARESTAQSVAEPEAPSAPVEAGRPQPEVAGERYVSEPLVIDLSERDHLTGFIDESREHTDKIETALLEVEANPSDTAKINELFRSFHTIKGIAGFLNLRDINRLTHEVETLLDLARKSALSLTPATIDLVFSTIDFLKRQVAELANYLAKPTGKPVPQPDIADIMARLQAAATGSAADPAAETDNDATRVLAFPEVERAPTASSRGPSSTSSGGGGDGGFSSAAETTIRVDTVKLDTLVDAVGELVIAQTMVNESEMVQRDDRLSRHVSQVTKIVRDVQETAMAMRMVPIGQTFRKMRRLLRDVAHKAGKHVELKISGEDTELDKNVIQAISDPLVHLVRNAVDHGVETPEQRRAAGKPEAGLVHLNAYHQGNTIVIEISDDGAGLDREKLMAKGVERGLVAPGEQLTDQQVFALILQPGFSTAQQITDISGRGVGMDVVKRNVEQLRGKIDILSEPGCGTVFTVRLPLTLAIIDGMLTQVGRERLIIPTILIDQALRPEARQITVVQRKGAVLHVRGELITLVQLGTLFGLCQPIDPADGLVVIARTESEKIGIVVDQLIGQQQVVIKSLGERFKHVRGVSGAAILGDGNVGLILEPTGLLALHRSSQSGTVWDAVGAPAAQASDDSLETPEQFQAEAVDAVDENQPATVTA
jgi:two-component system chemotaxis sensor kinase CheA